MSDPFQVVRDFEHELALYTGAPYVVTTTSCTTAILLACARMVAARKFNGVPQEVFSLPRFTYVGVAQSVINAGGKIAFRDETWVGEYQIGDWDIWDSARWLRAGMYRPHSMMCLSFHATKHLGLAAHGGAILLDDFERVLWLKRARFDGRTEGSHPSADTFQTPAWHAYMTPATAAEGLMRLATLPRETQPLPWGPGTTSDYPDLSKYFI